MAGITANVLACGDRRVIRHAVTAQVNRDNVIASVGEISDDVAVFKPSAKGPVQQHDQWVRNGTRTDSVQSQAASMNVSVLERTIQFDDGW